MSCESYLIVVRETDLDYDVETVRFPHEHEIDEEKDLGCMCGFTSRQGLQQRIHPSDIQMLAYLGAAVMLRDENIKVVPTDLPSWIREGIDAQFPAAPVVSNEPVPTKGQQLALYDREHKARVAAARQEILERNKK